MMDYLTHYMTLANSLFLLTGVVTGLASGILGIGGAFVMVPSLIFIFGKYYSFDPHTALELTLGTTMSCMIFNSISATLSHKKRDSINTEYIYKNFVLITIGTAIGVILTTCFSAFLIKLFFAGFCIYSGLKMIYKKASQLQVSKYSKVKVSVFGIICGFAGVGGASLFVNHFLNSENMPFKKAIGTASALQVPIATIGSLSYLILGFNHANPGAIGYIFLPALLLISIPCIVFVKLGVAIAHRIPVVKLKVLVGVFTIFIGVNMIVNVARSFHF